MRQLAQLFCFVINLTLASAMFALLFVLTVWLFDGASRNGFAEHMLVPAFWLSFALGWVPALMAYARIDHPNYPISTRSALFSYAKWGGISAAAVPFFLFSIMMMLDGFQGLFNKAALRSILFFAIWFFIPGAIAGAIFGALVPIGLPSSRDGRREAR